MLATGQAGPWAFIGPWAGPGWALAHKSPRAWWWPMWPAGFYQFVNLCPKVKTTTVNIPSSERVRVCIKVL